MGFLIERLKAFRHAFRGINTFWSESPHAQIHLVAVAVTSFFAFYFDLNRQEWVDLILCYALVIGLEAMNSAIEYAVDLSSPDIHPLAKKAKDVAAAGVLVAAIFAVIVAILIFSPKF